MDELKEILMLLSPEDEIAYLNYLYSRDDQEKEHNAERKKDIVERIEKLTDKQFELLIYLYSQQGQESAQVSQAVHPSSSLPA